MSFSHRVLLGLTLGLIAGLFFGELVSPLGIVATAFVRLLQMTVLPYVTLSIAANLGSLTYAQARVAGLRLGGILLVVWTIALLFALLVPLTFPDVESAAFYSPDLAAGDDTPNFLELYVPSNPFHSLANAIVPAVVLFSALFGLALIAVDGKQRLLDVMQTAIDAIGRMARFIVRLTPIGIFAIAADAAGTLEVAQLQRIEVYLLAYAAFALLLSFWVLPGLVAALTPFGALESLSTARDALLTAFLVGDLFIVLPALMDACSTLIERRIDSTDAARRLPQTIIPTSFTFPHTGKLLSVSFVLFAAWYSDTVVSLAAYPHLALSGFFSFFGSLNLAIPFLLEIFRIPADTFNLFLATGVVNTRFGTLLAAVHTVTIGLIGSAAISGALRIQPARLMRFVVTTVALTAVTVAGLRASLAAFVDLDVDSRAVVQSMRPLAFPPVDNRTVVSPADVPEPTLPAADAILAGIRQRGTLRVGLIGDGIPYAFQNDRGELVGFDVEMAQRLALDVGVDLQFVRFAQDQLEAQVARRTIDIVMTGARVTPERAAAFATSEPYLDETLAFVTFDYRRHEFESWTEISQRKDLHLGVQNLPYYVAAIRTLLPAAALTIIDETPELIDPDAPYDAWVLPAERGSVLTMLNPRFSVVIPTGATVRMPLAYPIAGDDPSWQRYVNTWIGLKKREGFVDALYQQWILGRAAEERTPRWSIIRDVLHWVD